MPTDSPAVRYLWILSTILALTFVALDSAARLRAVWAVTDSRIDTAPALQEDPTTVSGYVGNQHQLIMPTIGMDGYNWVMQAERMVAGTEGWRVRHVDYDFPPEGRDVEWSGFLHWEVTAMAWVGTHLTAIDLSSDGWMGRTRNLLFGPYRPGGLPMNLAIERVAPWTNTLTLVLFVLIAVPIAARRFGSVSASMLALGFAALYPLYDVFRVGYFDHHGLAATWDLLMVISLVAGGAGWLRGETGHAAETPKDEPVLWKWLPTRRQARFWFVASAVVGGAALWESASSTVPAMAGVGIGAVVSAAWLARGTSPEAPWRFEPALWRTWGRAGCAASLFFYLLEYFPSHLGWNLEVNHPLYALAWLGGGDLLCRTFEWIGRGTLGDTPSTRRRAVLFFAIDLLMVMALPVTIALTSKDTFRISDPFLWSLAADYILENRPLVDQLRRLTASEIASRISLLPLVLLPAVVVLWKTTRLSRARHVWRAMLAVLVVPALIFAHGAFHSVILHLLQEHTWLPGDAAEVALLTHGLALLADLVSLALLVGIPIRLRRRELPLPWKGVLCVALFPATVLLTLALKESRWLGVAYAAWLGVLVVMALVLDASEAFGRRWKIAALVFLVVVLLPFPASSIARWVRFDLKMPVTQMDITEVVVRDVSYRLRQRLGSEPGVIVSGPSTTTWMTFFGGFKGLGSLYSENLGGLKAVASIYNAPSAQAALELCRKFGVTHIAIYSWDAFAEEYARLWHGLRPSDPVPTDGFILRILKSGSIPNWLRPIPYPVPLPHNLANQYMLVFEVVPDQTIEEATVRAAQYLWEKDKFDAAMAQLRPLLAQDPAYLPALVCLAKVQQSRGDADGFREAVEKIRANLSAAGAMRLDDRVDLAVVMAFANDAAQAREQITGALEHADEKSLRHLLPDTLVNMVGLARRMNLSEPYANSYRLAFGLLPPEAKRALGN